MNKDDWTGIIIILGLVFLGLTGGSNIGNNNGPLLGGNPTPEQQQQNIQSEITNTQYKVDELKKQIEAEEAKKIASQYKDIVKLRYVTRSTNPSEEYMVIQVAGNITKPIKITGWTLKSLNTGASVTIPKSTILFFAGTTNPEEDVYVVNGDTIYLVTGISPNGYSFKVNKCSGYLNQFQTFVPYLYTSCPEPRNENISSIPKTTINDACLDYIQYFPSCRIQTETLPLNWSYECTNFIYNKINYPSCVNTHKNDKDFYQHEWRIYLKRSATLWKDRRENIVLYDEFGKVVSTLIY